MLFTHFSSAIQIPIADLGTQRVLIALYQGNFRTSYCLIRAGLGEIYHGHWYSAETVSESVRECAELAQCCAATSRSCIGRRLAISWPLWGLALEIADRTRSFTRSNVCSGISTVNYCEPLIARGGHYNYRSNGGDLSRNGWKIREIVTINCLSGYSSPKRIERIVERRTQTQFQAMAIKCLTRRTCGQSLRFSQ